jgi:hypothetical protein
MVGFYMVDGEEWKDKLFPGNKSHITAQFVNEQMIFVNFGVVEVPEWPVFSP